MRSPLNERKRFLDHLEDLRKVIIKSLVCFGLAFVVSLPLVPHLLQWLTVPLSQAADEIEPFLRSIQITGAFSASMRLAAGAALAASVPLILWFVWQFIFPALTDREVRVGRCVLTAALTLFALGVALCYLFILPAALRVMWRWHAWLGVRPEWTLNSYITFAMHLLLGFGVAFELPVLVFGAGVLGLVSSASLRRIRRHVIVGVLVLAMLLTPPDVFTQIVMALPVLLLYELCVLALALWERRPRA